MGLAKLACEYERISRGFSYDFNENGEAQLLRVLSQVDEQSPVVIDGGANIGLYADAVIDHFGQSDLTLHCFEMSEDLANHLASKYQKETSVFVHGTALSSTTGEMAYRHYEAAQIVNTLVVDIHDHHGLPSSLRRTETISGDDFASNFGIEKILLLKLDCEGWEFPIIEGFKGQLAGQRVSVLQWEYGYANGDTGFLLRDFYRFLRPLGYEIGRLTRNGVAFADFEYQMNNFDSGPHYIAALPSFVPTLRDFRQGKCRGSDPNDRMRIHDG